MEATPVRRGIDEGRFKAGRLRRYLWSNLSEVGSSIRAAPRALRRPLTRAATISDLRRIALRRVPRAVFDYVDGGAEAELSMKRSLHAFSQLTLHPRILRDVSDVSLRTEILGTSASMPLVLAPTGFTRMMHPQGEMAVAAAAAEARLPYALSTLGTTSPEDLAAVIPSGPRWFQLYLWQDRQRSRDLIQRVAAAGFDAMVLTVDVPVAGNRLRDVRNGLTLPPALTVRAMLDAALHPSWWLNYISAEPLRFATHTEEGTSVQDIIDTMFDPSLTFDDISWLRGQWSRTLVVKGVMRTDDARTLADLGVDAIVVSNHGGRQLDRSVTPLHILPSIVDVVGERLAVLLDGGVRTGADVVAAVALGATACMIGRAYLYGLMAGGRAGVVRALEILREEGERTMRLLGARRIDELDPSLVSFGSRPVDSP